MCCAGSNVLCRIKHVVEEQTNVLCRIKCVVQDHAISPANSQKKHPMSKAG